MTPNCWSEIMVLIKAGYDSHGRTFTPIVRDSIHAALTPLPDDLVKAAVNKVLTWESEWPAHQQAIIQAAVDIASPVPDADSAWLDVTQRIIRDRPAMHPLVERTVETFGGIDVLYHLSQTDNRFYSSVRSQFVVAYERQVAIWRQAVAGCLLTGRRDPQYFPRIEAVQRMRIEQVPAVKQLPDWSEPPNVIRDLLESLKTTNRIEEI